MLRSDVLIIGSGIAGLLFAIKVAKRFPDQTVTIVTKSSESESNTKYAQGGIAVVQDALTDAFHKHVDDTLRAGDGLCDRTIVELVVREGPKRLKELIEWGIEFDRDDAGNLALGKEGGHTEKRIVHCRDFTGLQIVKRLLHLANALPNLTLLSHHFSVDLLTDTSVKSHLLRAESGSTCYGAYVMDEHTCKVERYRSKVTLLATGGAGQVYRTTTNPLIATGDGVAMAHRAGTSIKNMAFVQFHPTAFYSPQDNPCSLITEAIRGYGAQLRTRDGQRFMFKYDDRGELASRDIVSMAINRELMARGDSCVFLDCTAIPKADILLHFPSIYEQCLSKGIDASTQMIPVVPAAHYQCGGIEVNEHGQTSIDNLYACGECACTGLHGANRLASNSLLEALVYAHRCFKDVEAKLSAIEVPENIADWRAAGTMDPREQMMIAQRRNELRDLMSDHVAIVRSHESLKLAMKRMVVLYLETEQLYHDSVLSPQLCELRNLIAVALLIIRQSQGQEENRGTFFNADLM